MSGLDPATAAALSAAVNAADLQFLETALSLGASVDVLQAQISTGDIVAAVILPPQNGQDIIEIAGQTVAAQLPPNVHPGETIALQVTGFSGNQILVRNLGVIDPHNPPVLTDLNLEPPQPGAMQTGTLTTVRPSPQTPPAQSGTQNAPQNVAPPKEIFVAASVVRTAAPPPAAASAAAAGASAAGAKAAVPPPIDVRIAAAQNAARVAPPPVNAPSNRPPGRAPDITATLSPVMQRSSVARTVSDSLRAAKLPDNAFTRTVTAIAGQAPQRLAHVLRRLETALEQVPNEPRAMTARTIAAFVSRMNLANRETLPAQIEAFVSHVLRGAEVKLTALLQALNEAAGADAAHEDGATPAAAAAASANATAGENAGESASQGAGTAGGASSQPGAGRAAVAPARTDSPPAQAATQIQAHARAAVLAAARDHDLKTALLALARDFPAGRAPTLSQALNESLVTLAATQLHTLTANAQSPGTITIPLPAIFYDGGKPAYLRISRDGGNGSGRMDADNFHIGFVLDTANLGTVGIDVRTVGRAVNVDVKTETAPAAARFRDSFTTLRERLESMRYRIGATSAAMLQPAAQQNAQSQPPHQPAQHGEKPSSTLDAQA